MKFTTPLGLLGLIGFLLLILIYVLKPKFQEKSISSTFIWKLSLNYKRQKTPFQWIKSSLLVIIQFLILALITLALTTPFIDLGSHSKEKIVILDASANMLAESNGKTRFERAIQEISAMADVTTPDHRFTVIVAGHEASFVARRLDSAKYIKQLLSELVCTYDAADIEAAIKLTEGVLAENPDAEVILFTGNQYSEVGTTSVRDLSSGEWNLSILDFTAELKDGYYEFVAKVASFNSDFNGDMSLYVDDQLLDVKTVEFTENEETLIRWQGLHILEYDKAEVIFEVDDDFIYDNRFAIFGWENEMFSVQIVSENPRFLQAAMLTMGNFKIDIPVAPDLNSPVPVRYEGYDLYIFDSFDPAQMPSDGSVWLINPTTIPGEADTILGVKLTGDFVLSAPSDMSPLESQLLNSINPAAITLSSYSHIVPSDSFDQILLVDDDPVVMIKDIEGQKLIVFAFSLHHSNLPIIPEYILMLRNLSRYSAQNMVEKFLFEAGDEVSIRKKPQAIIVNVEFETNDVLYDEFPIDFVVEKPGVYSVTQTIVSGDRATIEFFVRIAEDQSDFQNDYGVLLDPIRPNTGVEIDVTNDALDIVVYLAGILMFLMIVEWGLHYYEHN
jgi:Ca-activated chloride channel homolog